MWSHSITDNSIFKIIFFKLSIGSIFDIIQLINFIYLLDYILCIKKNYKFKWNFKLLNEIFSRNSNWYTEC